MGRSPLSFWQLWNMNFGFLGIQFGWGLQMANSQPARRAGRPSEGSGLVYRFPEP